MPRKAESQPPNDYGVGLVRLGTKAEPYDAVLVEEQSLGVEALSSVSLQRMVGGMEGHAPVNID